MSFFSSCRLSRREPIAVKHVANQRNVAKVKPYNLSKDFTAQITQTGPARLRDDVRDVVNRDIAVEQHEDKQDKQNAYEVVEQRIGGRVPSQPRRAQW